MHIGASIHAELLRCSKTIGLLGEQHCLNHEEIITEIVYGDFLLLPWAVGLKKNSIIAGIGHSAQFYLPLLANSLKHMI